MLEPMFPMIRAYTYVHTLSHGLELVAGIDGAAVVVDTGHLWWDARLLEQFRAHVADIGTVQLTNISSGALDRLRYDARTSMKAKSRCERSSGRSTPRATPAGTSTRC